MGRRSLRVSGALLAALGLSLGLLWAREKETAPAGTTVEVTYYYLPG